MPTIKGLFFIILLLLVVNPPQIKAQLDTMSDDTVTVLNRINQARRQQNIVPLVPNAVLNDIAQVYVTDLIGRPIGALGDTFVTSDGKGIEDLLTERGYESYEGIGYFADLFSAVIRGFPPDQLYTYLIDDANKPQREILSRQMIRQGKTILPIGDPLYREVGIAYAESQGRNFYVIITASRPNVLPVIITQRPDIHVLTQTVTSRDVFLWVNDEKVERRGGEDVIGGVRFIRVSEQPDLLECPTTPNNGWQRYVNATSWTVSDGEGPKTVYVQMCDERNRTITMSAEVNYSPGVEGSTSGFTRTPTPDVLAIANATQTAAASATAYAPYLQTVEAILTATAAAPTPTPNG